MTYEADSGGGGRGSASLKTASSGIDCWLRSGDSKVGIGRGGSQGEGDVRGGDLLVEFKLRACSLMRECSMTLIWERVRLRQCTWRETLRTVY